MWNKRPCNRNFLAIIQTKNEIDDFDKIVHIIHRKTQERIGKTLYRLQGIFGVDKLQIFSLLLAQI